MLNGFFTFIFAAAAELCAAFAPHNGFAERNKGAFPQEALPCFNLFRKLFHSCAEV